MTWSRDNDTQDRMERVIRESKIDAESKVRLLEGKMAEVRKLLHDVARYQSGLTPDECSELAALLDTE